MRASTIILPVLAVTFFTAGCTKGTSSALMSAPSATAAASTATDVKPGYEPGYFDGQVVMMNAIEVPQNKGPLEHAVADFYQVVYPTNHALWPSDPQCNPCDHQGNGIDPTDFHDHVLDSIPGDPGHGEYNPKWHVFLIMPAPGKDAAYAARLPLTSEEDIDQAIADHVAIEIDTNFYFICAVVGQGHDK